MNILLSLFIWIFNHLRLCLATAIHNLKWVKITHEYLFNLRPNIYKSWCLSSHLIPYNSDLIG